MAPNTNGSNNNNNNATETTPLIMLLGVMPPNGCDSHSNNNNNNGSRVPEPFESSVSASSVLVDTSSMNGSNSMNTTSNSRRSRWMGMDSSSHASRFTASMRQLSSHIAQMVAHHTGSIGMLGSISIAVNSITGPAMVNLPATFARSGIIPTITTLCLVCVLSALCSLHMANSISKVPGNATFKKEVEFSEAFRVFWGQKWFLVTQVLFLCCITCLNISSIVDTSQVVDTFAGNWWPGGTAAIQIVCPDDRTEMYVRWLRWDAFECTKQELFDGLCIPFTNNDDDNSILVTAGNILTTALFLPLALMDLKENSWWQILGFFILLLTSLQFIIQFSMAGLHPSYLTWRGTDWDDLLGVVLFNFALVVAVPAWLYEREPDVDVPTVIHTSSIMAVVMYICIGLLGSMALPNVSDNMLESMMSGSLGTTMQLGASLFAFAIIGLGIPLFSVLTRLNLTGSGLCSHRTGNILAVYFPFAAAWLLSDGAAITKLLSWGGIVFTSLVAFILPLILALHVVNEVDSEGSISVYGGWLTEKGPHLMSVRVLLTIAVVAIFVAIVGNLVDLG